MKLIKEIDSKRDRNGVLIKWGKFLCEFCFKEVEMKLGDGYKCKSCGCNKNKGNKYGYKHGETKTRLHRIWTGMKTRCFNFKHTFYAEYGGRGITICPEWSNKLNGFLNFRDWSLSNGYADDLVIDRKNPNGNYEPLNCRWLTILESNRNKTNTITLEIANEIRKLYKTGNYSQYKLAKLYNVTQPLISLIINNKIWV